MPWKDVKPPHAHDYPRGNLNNAIGLGSVWECQCGLLFEIVEIRADAVTGMTPRWRQVF